MGNLKNEYDLKNEDDLKNENDIKNDIKNGIFLDDFSPWQPHQNWC